MTIAPMSPLPVVLLTGFLGSGKTTLLARLVHDVAFGDTAVIINEFGAIGLDHVLLQKSDDRDVVLLDSGCLCCASNSPLQDSLEALYYQRLRGEVPPFSRVVVETSGLADPLPLINAIAADASVARHYRFAGVLTVLDAVHGLANLQQFDESALQLAVADKLLLSKTDLATPDQVALVRAAVHEARPDVSVAEASTLAPAQVLAGLPGLVNDGGGERAASVDAGAAAADDRVGRRAPAGPARFRHLARYGIASHALRFDAPLDWGRYAALVWQLQRTLGEQLLRAKGVLRIADGDGEVACFAVHGVRHLFSPPQALVVEVPSAQAGTVILITRAAAREEIEAMAKAVGARLLPSVVSRGG